ncbi:sirohydrochlorin cobaltochelatase [Pseudodesulfovibrio pelocollis]|uniref:sirohydrochlorin cobaltochelatase n=1 Tax=Pseudodesulfovibrio pelocollis TaxID=3051432 RepID=UPI00255AB0BD|nr:sirohydrochlorin cobaltochelatase [Pseudodesulfovibrio sp. SB368]
MAFDPLDTAEPRDTHPACPRHAQHAHHGHEQGGQCGCHHDHDHDHEHDHGHDHGHGHDHLRPPKYKPGILLAAFGVAIDEARRGYDLFEAEVRQRHPGMELAWAYTAHKVRRKLNRRGRECDSLAVALSRLHDKGVTHLAVQSLHTTPGVEYYWTREQSLAYRHPRKGFPEVVVGGPLLLSEQDLDRSCQALQGYIPAERSPEQAVVLVGHGTYHHGQQRYLDFQERVQRDDPLIRVGTLMGRPACDDVMAGLEADGVKDVWLVPFMCVPGHHVHLDVFGNGPSSWKNRMEHAGFTVRGSVTGTLEHAPFRTIWLEHLDQACAHIRAQETA